MSNGLETIVTTNSKQGVLNDPENNIKYLIEGELGRGGMGIVYHGWVEKKDLVGSNKELEEIVEQGISNKTLTQIEKGSGVDSDGKAKSGLYLPVAIKVVKEDYLAKQGESAIARFERESIIQKRYANHPNVVKVFQSGQGLLKLDGAQNGDACHYIAMELLNNLMKPEEIMNLDVRNKLHISKQMLSVIAQLHTDGTMHRDIKPENILITRNLDAKLADFGLGKDSDDMGLTQTGGIMGSPIYMSPEQAMGTKLNHLSDIFSMGATIYELITGEKPFKIETGENALYVLIMAKQSEDFILAPHPKLPSVLYHTLLCATAVKKEKRFQSANEFKIALDECGRIMFEGETKFDALARTIDVSRSIQKRAKRAGFYRKIKELNSKLTPWQYVAGTALLAGALYLGYQKTFDYAVEKQSTVELDSILNESALLKKTQTAAASDKFKYTLPVGRTFSKPSQQDISDFLKLDQFKEFYVAMRINPELTGNTAFAVEFNDDKNKYQYVFGADSAKYFEDRQETTIPYDAFKIKPGEKIELVLWKHEFEGKIYLSVMAGKADSKEPYKFILPSSTKYPAVSGNNFTVNPLESKIEEVVQCGKK